MAVPQLSGVRSVGNRWAQRRDLAERQRITTYRHSGNTGMWLIILLGTITGLALSLTGSGGSIFAVPMLVYGVDTPLAQAVAMSLLAVAATAAVGAARGLFARAVDVRTGLLFAATGKMGTPLGVGLGDFIDDVVRLSAFALLKNTNTEQKKHHAGLPDAGVRAAV